MDNSITISLDGGSSSFKAKGIDVNFSTDVANLQYEQATTNAQNAANMATDAAENATTATTAAETATENAITATANVNNAINDAEIAITNAENATQNATTADETATTAANNAITATNAATAATTDATTATTNANTATTLANEAALSANNAATTAINSVMMYDCSAKGTVTFDTLTLAIAAVPLAYQKGGLHIKYVDTSSNKYVVYFLTTPTWSTVISDWRRTANEVDIANLGADLIIIKNTPISQICNINEYFLLSGNSIVLKNDNNLTRRSDYIPVTSLRHVRTNGINDVPSILYSSDKNIASYISSELADGDIIVNNWHVYDKDITIPATAIYAVVQWNSNTLLQSGEYYINGTIEDRLHKIEKIVDDNSLLIYGNFNSKIKISDLCKKSGHMDVNNGVVSIESTPSGFYSDYIDIAAIDYVRTNGNATVVPVLYFSEKNILSYVGCEYVNSTQLPCNWAVFDGILNKPTSAKYAVVQFENASILINGEYYIFVTTASYTKSKEYTDQKLSLLASNDLQHFYVINKTAYIPKLGRKALRDPSPIQIGDWYYIVYTALDFAKGSLIGMCRTHDFVNFEELPQLNITINGTVISDSCVWAPSWFLNGYDYYIIINCNIEGVFKSYYAKYDYNTHSISDITSFNLPYTNTIDTHIYKENGYYYAITKKESETVIAIAKCETFNGAYTAVSSNISSFPQYEGPFILRLDSGKVRMIMQNLSDSNIYQMRYTDADNLEGIWSNPLDIKYDMDVSAYRLSHANGLDLYKFGVGF